MGLQFLHAASSASVHGDLDLPGGFVSAVMGAQDNETAQETAGHSTMCCKCLKASFLGSESLYLLIHSNLRLLNSSES